MCCQLELQSKPASHIPIWRIDGEMCGKFYWKWHSATGRGVRVSPRTVLFTLIEDAHMFTHESFLFLKWRWLQVSVWLHPFIESETFEHTPACTWCLYGSLSQVPHAHMSQIVKERGEVLNWCLGSIWAQRVGVGVDGVSLHAMLVWRVKTCLKRDANQGFWGWKAKVSVFCSLLFLI